MNFTNRFLSWWLGTGFASLIIAIVGVLSPELIPLGLVVMAMLNVAACFLTLTGRELDR